MSAAQHRSRGELEIISEVVMAAIPRGDEELRVTFTRARTAQGKDVAWHSIRVFWRTDDGEWKPGKQGITIRGKELKPITEALLKASAGNVRQENAAPAERPQPRAGAAQGAPVAPFGRAKGTPLADLEDDDLRWLESALAASIGDPAKAAYKAKNEKDHAAVTAEMRGRFLE